MEGNRARFRGGLGSEGRILTTVALVLFGVSVAMAAWSYVLYPPILRALSRRAGTAPSIGPLPTSVEVIVSAADEESVIADRVRNLLGQRVSSRYRVSVGCDGPTDATAARAREAGDDRLRVVEFPVRRGKAAVLNDLTAASDADLLVFTDANTHFEENAVERLMSPFAAPEVGAACGRLILEAGETESLFWDRETSLKEAEGKLGVCLGANGAIYAARRQDVAPLPLDTAMDDFLIPLRVARRGRQVVFVGDAVAREQTSGDVLHEMSRRFRIGVGAGQVLRREAWLFAFWRHPLLTFAFVSRKGARWLAPVVALLAALAAAMSANRLMAGVGWICLGSAVLGGFSALARLRLRGFAGRLYYFGVINVALATGVAAGLLGKSRAIWKPAQR